MCLTPEILCVYLVYLFEFSPKMGDEIREINEYTLARITVEVLER